jgi:hypothetical protein
MGANHENAEDRDRTGLITKQDSPVLGTLCLKAEDGIRTRDPHHGKVMFYH